VLLGRIFENHHVLALPPLEAEFGDSGGGVVEKPLAVFVIHPGPGHHPGTIARTDLGLIGIDEHVQRRRIHQPLFGQQRLQRLDPQYGIRQR
jgi:hypothetical protein